MEGQAGTASTKSKRTERSRFLKKMRHQARLPRKKKNRKIFLKNKNKNNKRRSVQRNQFVNKKKENILLWDHIKENRKFRKKAAKFKDALKSTSISKGELQLSLTRLKARCKVSDEINDKAEKEFGRLETTKMLGFGTHFRRESIESGRSCQPTTPLPNSVGLVKMERTR